MRSTQFGDDPDVNLTARMIGLRLRALEDDLRRGFRRDALLLALVAGAATGLAFWLAWRAPEVRRITVTTPIPEVVVARKFLIRGDYGVVGEFTAAGMGAKITIYKRDGSSAFQAFTDGERYSMLSLGVAIPGPGRPGMALVSSAEGAQTFHIQGNERRRGASGSPRTTTRGPGG